MENQTRYTVVISRQTGKAIWICPTISTYVPRSTVEARFIIPVVMFEITGVNQDSAIHNAELVYANNTK